MSENQKIQKISDKSKGGGQASRRPSTASSSGEGSGYARAWLDCACTGPPAGAWLRAFVLALVAGASGFTFHRTDSKQIATTVLAAVVVASTLLPFVAVAASSTAVGATSAVSSPSLAGGPGDLERVPDANIHDRVPQFARDDVVNASHFRGSTVASEHSSSLEVTVGARYVERGENSDGTLDTATSRLTSEDEGEIVLTLTDEKNHEGRTVGVPKDALKQSLGYVPQQATVQHESGDVYTQTLEQEGQLVLLEIREFSTNTVTFSSEVMLTGNPATDGTQFQYNVSDLDAVQNYTINVTGSTAIAWDNESAGALANGDTMPLNVAGNLAPTGPSANGEPVVEFVGEETGTDRTATGTGVASDTASVTNGNLNATGPSANGNPTLTITGKSGPTQDNAVTVPGDRNWSITRASDPRDVEMVMNTTVDVVGKVRIYVKSGTSTTTPIYISNEMPNHNATDGTKVHAGASLASGWNTIDVDDFENTGGDYVTVQWGSDSGDSTGVQDDAGCACMSIDTGGGSWTTYNWKQKGGIVGANPSSVDASADDGTSVSYSSFGVDGTLTKEFDMTASASSVNLTGTDGTFDYNLTYTSVNATEDPSFDLGNDGTTEASHTGLLRAGETATYELAGLSTSTTTAAAGTAAGTVGARIKFKERTQTDSPAVEVNGHTTSHTGTLADGKTVSLSTNTSWVKEGLNQVNVSAADPSADAPTPEVGLDYSHEAVSNKSVDYVGETWTERYNVSKTFDSDRQAASLTVPFASDRVVTVRDVEKRVNGGSWTDVASSATSFDGSRLEVNLGEVKNGDVVDVRANGSKVVTHGMEIQVTSPTQPGDSLATSFEVASMGGGESYIAVGGTSPGDRLHYLYNESWQDVGEYARVWSDGAQRIYLPNAGTGSSATVSTLPLEIVPETGAANLSDVQPGGTPRFKVDPGTNAGDTVKYRYLATTPGTEYLLYSVTNGVVRDSATANSPVLLVDDDSEEVLEIREGDGDGSSGGGGGGGAAIAPIQAGSGFFDNVPVLLFASIAGLGALGLVANRFLDDNRLVLAVLGAGTLVVLAVSGEAVTPESVLASLGEAVATGPIGENLGQVVRVGGTIGVLVGAWYIYANHIKGRDGPTFVLEGRRK